MTNSAGLTIGSEIIMKYTALSRDGWMDGWMDGDASWVAMCTSEKMNNGVRWSKSKAYRK